MTTGLQISFLSLAPVLWVSSYGYIFALTVMALRRRMQRSRPMTEPRIAVIIPTLNEETLIRGKLEDLRRTDYPREQMTIIVVDGGSWDRTQSVVEERMQAGDGIRLQRLSHTHGRADQIARAVSDLDHEIVVITDVDARLEPSCIRELVRTLIEDRRTGLVGALARPHTGLLEEHLHWRLVNYLWWLEGEVLSSALVSGVCFAARREALRALVPHAATEDVQLALPAAAHGYRVRICTTALATEIRVPQTARELVQFRRRHGGAYLRELVRSRRYTDTPRGWRLARQVRLWHILATPALAVLCTFSAAALLLTPQWPLPVFTLTAFILPALSLMGFSFISSHSSKWHVSRLGFAATRLVLLTWLSLTLTIRRVIYYVLQEILRDPAASSAHGVALWDVPLPGHVSDRCSSIPAQRMQPALRVLPMPGGQDQRADNGTMEGHHWRPGGSGSDPNQVSRWRTHNAPRLSRVVRRGSGAGSDYRRHYERAVHPGPA
jgi:cellulose synthase/poly-beta-1,6-N-acetylglucosamine synthase-like glycosyltransferase